MQNVVTFMSKTIKADSASYSASGEAKIVHVDVRPLSYKALFLDLDKAWNIPRAGYDDCILAIFYNYGVKFSDGSFSPINPIFHHAGYGLGPDDQ